MKITTIFAGHRSNGNTARVLGWVEERLKGLGHRVERINLGSKKINGCSNCLRCNGGDCVQEDDGNPIIQRMAVSDAVIFASPLYHKYLSSQLKALLERLGGFRGHADKNGLPAAGQPQALIMTISSIFDAKAWQCLESFEQALQRCKARCAGKLIVCNCSSPDLLNGQTRTMANALAEELFFRKNAPFSLLISEPRLRNRIAPADGQPF